jgi:hypothetical protein
MKSYARMLATMAVVVLTAPMLSLHAQSQSSPSGTTSKVDLFLGYTRFGTASTQATTGNRMVGLNGGSASIAFNFNSHLGLVADVGGYDTNQLLLTGTGANLPRTADASGTTYTYLAGPRLSFRKANRVSPFLQALFGGVHAGQVTLSGCTGSLCTALPSQNSFAMTAGGGLDIRWTRHIAIRAVQAEYMMTRFANPTSAASASQNDLRLSTGLVFRFGGGVPPAPVTYTCSAAPGSIYPGDPITVMGTAMNLNPKKTVFYTWTSDVGPVMGNSSTASINTSSLSAGTYTVKGHVSEGAKPAETADCSAQFTVRAFDPPTVSCSAAPSTVQMGGSSTINARGMSPQNRPLTYSYSASSGSISGNSSTATLLTAGASSGSIIVTCNVSDDKGQMASSSAGVSVQLPISVTPPPPPPAPMSSNLCAVNFGRDKARPERVDNEAKACLDDVALNLQRSSSAKLALIGNSGSSRQLNHLAEERAVNTKTYLVTEKGIDASRIMVYTGSTGDNTVTTILIAVGASMDNTNATPVNENRIHAQPRRASSTQK